MEMPYIPEGLIGGLLTHVLVWLVISRLPVVIVSDYQPLTVGSFVSIHATLLISKLFFGSISPNTPDIEFKCHGC